MSRKKGKGQKTSPEHPRHRSEPQKYKGRSAPFLEAQDLEEILGRDEINMQGRLDEVRPPVS